MQKLKHYTSFEELKAVTKKPSKKALSDTGDKNVVREFIILLRKNSKGRAER